MWLSRNKLQPDADGYFPAFAANELVPESMRQVKIGGHAILISSLDGQFHAFSASCPHAAGNLSEGTLFRGRLDCPDHGYRFDVRTGRPIWPEDEVCRLKKYPVKVERGMIMVQLP